jgi:hypothetical protein
MGANRQPVLGHIDCPVCGFAEMQIKHDKNGDASGYCPDCSQQLFTRNPHKSGLLMKRMRPLEPGAAAPVDLAPKEPAPVAVPVFVAPAAAAKAPPARQAGVQGENAGKVAPINALPEKTAQKPVKSVEPEKPAGAGGWWAPVLGKSARKGAPA